MLDDDSGSDSDDGSEEEEGAQERLVGVGWAGACVVPCLWHIAVAYFLLSARLNPLPHSRAHVTSPHSLFGRRRRPSHLRDYEVYAGADASSDDDNDVYEVRRGGGGVICACVCACALTLWRFVRYRSTQPFSSHTCKHQSARRGDEDYSDNDAAAEEGCVCGRERIMCVCMLHHAIGSFF